MGPPGLSGSSLYHGIFLGFFPAYKPLQTVTYFLWVGGDGHGGGGLAYLLIKIRPLSKLFGSWNLNSLGIRFALKRPILACNIGPISFLLTTERGFYV